MRAAPTTTQRARTARCAALLLALLASCQAERTPAVTAQAPPLAAPVKTEPAAPAVPASFRTERACAGGAARLNLDTLEPGAFLVWNTNGSALAVGSSANRSTVVVVPGSSVLTNAPPAAEPPPRPKLPAGFFRAVWARAANVAVGIERPFDAGLVVWHAGRLKRIAVQGIDSNAVWVVNDRGDQLAVPTGKQVQIFALDRAAPVRVVPLTEPVLALAYRPASNELAVSTTTSVSLLQETGVVELLGQRVAEPAQGSVTLSPSDDTLAIDLDQRLLALSLADGTLHPASPPALDVNLVSPDGSTTVTLSGRHPRLTSKAGSVTLTLRREIPKESPDAFAVAFSPDSKTLFVLESLHLPRSSASRISAWNVSDGAFLWSQPTDSSGSITPTAHGVIAALGSLDRFEGGKSVFSANRGPFAYSPARDLLAVLDRQSVKLVGPNAAPLVFALPFSEPVGTLAFDEAGLRLALGTAEGLHVVNLAGREIVHVDLGAVTEALGFRDDLAIVRCVSPHAPERAFSIVDVRSGATLTLGFALTTDSTLRPFVSTSTGWVDAEPAVLASLHDSAHPEAAVPPACLRAGLLHEWLSAP